MSALINLGGAPLKEQIVTNRLQRRAEEQAQKTTGEDAADEPEKAEHYWQLADLAKDIGSEKVIDTADEEQTPSHDENMGQSSLLDGVGPSGRTGRQGLTWPRSP